MFDVEGRAKPVLKWAGGKSQLLPQLIGAFPVQFNRLIEPFLGGAAVALCVKPGVPALLNDGNFELVNLYEVIRDDPDGLMRALDILAKKYNQDFYYGLRAQQPHSNVERAARTLFLNKTGFNGLYRQNRKGQFNVPFGHRKKCPRLYDPQNLRDVSARLAHAVLTQGDFARVIDSAGAGDFVYCDPPYEPLSQTSSFNTYTGSGFSREDQARLRDVCRDAARRGACVAISNSVSPFILDLYAGEDVRRVTARRAINSNGRGRGEIEEVVVLMHGWVDKALSSTRRESHRVGG